MSKPQIYPDEVLNQLKDSCEKIKENIQYCTDTKSKTRRIY